MRVLAWALLRPRTWFVLGAAYAATVLAEGDGKPAWTLMVALATYALAGLSIWAHYLQEHEPDEPDDEPAAPARSRHDEWVAESVRRYEASRGRAAPEPAAVETPVEKLPAEARSLSKREREVAEIVRRYEEQAEARRAALKEARGPQ